MERHGCCPSGGTGRRTGLKILRDLTLVPVQVRPWAPFKNNRTSVLFFFLLQKNKKRELTLFFTIFLILGNPYRKSFTQQ